MFCYQCERASESLGCVDGGACGKSAETGELHDVLFHVARQLAVALRALPADAGAAYHPFIEDALFATMSNVNYDADLIESMIRRGQALLAGVRGTGSVADAGRRIELLGLAGSLAIPVRRKQIGADLVGLQEILAYGIKGLAAISRQARSLGQMSAQTGDFLVAALAELAQAQPDAERLLALCLCCGEVAIKAMDRLDSGNTQRFGHPEPSEVRKGHRKGKAILVSGHELDDLERILQISAGTGVDVYTHGEMMAAHGYPELKRHPHLVGHHGGAWHDQHKVFAAFPGAIVMTGSCLMPPRKAYRSRLFTMGAMAYPGVRQVAADDLSPVLDCALAQPGFIASTGNGSQWVGFGHRSTTGAMDILVDAVRAGEIDRFVLIGGCDGPTSGRDYFSRLAVALPKSWAVLTLGCGKFRVLGHVEGNIRALPRLLDIGQCSDTFSAIKISKALALGLGVELRDLPLSLVLSWHEQKAVTIVLALLHLGLRNIRIGPRMPAFVGPAMLKIFVDRFGLIPTGDVAGDIRAMAMSA
ncbi:MAG: hydroxylamine reductase [Betaproteobacteria bacterium]|nr:hydroxylamine reductase [Betaproteobacteria bacterium]